MHAFFAVVMAALGLRKTKTPGDAAVSEGIDSRRQVPLPGSGERHGPSSTGPPQPDCT